MTEIYWVARAPGGGGGGTVIASAMGDNPAYGDALPAGDWEITPVVYFEGQGVAQMATPKRFVLAKIEKVEWTESTLSGAGELVPDNGDFRIYPDASAAGGGFNFAVNVLASVIPAVSGIKVQFKAYDVDDPSDFDGPIDNDRDDDPVDPNDAPNDVNEPDNLLGGMGSLAQPMITTDSGGKAQDQFTVTQRPGDNYRISVAGRISQFNTIKAYESYEGQTPPPAPSTALFNDLNEDGSFQAASEGPLLDESNPSGDVNATPLLTVWRKVRVEIDTFAGLGEVNHVYGQITQVTPDPPNPPNPQTWTVKTDQTLNDSVNRFEGGQMTNGAEVFDVHANTAEADFELVVSNPTTGIAPVLGVFGLHDDDTRYSGKPDKSLFNLFDAAFITATEVGSQTASVQGQINVESDEFDAQINLGKDLVSSQAYWIAYVQGSFQGEQTLDFDPDPITEEGWRGGETRMGQGSLIHLEVIRDFAGLNPFVLEQQVVVHEIGHQFDKLYEQDPVTLIWWHDSEGVMLPNPNGDAANSFFGEESQLRLRTSTTVNE